MPGALAGPGTSAHGSTFVFSRHVDHLLPAGILSFQPYISQGICHNFQTALLYDNYLIYRVVMKSGRQRKEMKKACINAMSDPKFCGIAIRLKFSKVRSIGSIRKTIDSEFRS